MKYIIACDGEVRQNTESDKELEEQRNGYEYTGRSWQIDEDVRIFECRSDRNHLSVEVHCINEATSRENDDAAQAMAITALTILEHPKGGNY